MKILVTGGAGFIGSHIVDGLLAAGHCVAVLDDLSSGSRENLPENVPLHGVDIVDGKAVAKAFAAERPDAVCHQAAQMSVSRSVRDPLFDAQVNCIGLINVLDAAAKHGCKRVVFASSGGVLYGDVTSPAAESTPANPVSPYGITKWVGERYLRFFAEEYGLETLALRYSNVFGPRQNPHGEAGVVAIFCKKLLAGEAATINGDGRYIRDYVYGPDVARANVIALTGTIQEVRPKTLTSLNIGSGIGTDVNQLEAMVRQSIAEYWNATVTAAPLPAPLHGPARAGDLRSNLLDATLASRVLGWKPTVSLASGVAQTVAWFAQHLQ
ncbi:MAG: UDP-glucose 4-epimerase [Planctomycetaceae bacterium]|nr:MAG: UDP-glucose 4-epimerase [Planctomycetaceae bacterium]